MMIFVVSLLTGSSSGEPVGFHPHVTPNFGQLTFNGILPDALTSLNCDTGAASLEMPNQLALRGARVLCSTKPGFTWRSS
jgi:hypothetical protein